MEIPVEGLTCDDGAVGPCDDGSEPLMCYGTNPILNDLIVIVDFDKTIFAFIPVKFKGNIILLTWKVAGAPTAALFVPSRTT